MLLEIKRVKWALNHDSVFCIIIQLSVCPAVAKSRLVAMLIIVLSH